VTAELGGATGIVTPLDLVALGFATCEVAAPLIDGSCSCRLGNGCPSPGKHPVGRAWLKRALLQWTNPRVASMRLGLVPVCSYGLIPMPGSRMIGVDQDDPSVVLSIPDTFTVSRRSAPAGRAHYYLHLADGIDENDVPRVFAGGEVRVAGSGHLVGPGCRHVSGDTYEPNGLPIAEASAALIDELRSRPAVRRVSRSASDGDDDRGWRMEPGSVGEGERHPWLVGQARAMRGWGWDVGRIEEGLRELNDEMCSPPLPDRVAEFDRMAEWAVRHIRPDRGLLIKRRPRGRIALRQLKAHP
jgi:hypothetical protein